jgi:hypothetical protein
VEALDAAGNLGFAETSFSFSSPKIVVSQSPENFGSVFVGGASSIINYTVSNAGADNLSIITSTLTGANSSEYFINATTCTDSKILIPTDNCSVIVGLSPVSAGVKTASLSITSSDPYTPLKNISLNGNGALPNLNVTMAGAGAGTATSSPAGISCGSVCANAFTTGTQVALSVLPGIGSFFTGWTGACAGVEAMCNVILDDNISVTVNLEMGNAARILSGLTPYGTIQAALDTAASGDTIQSRYMLIDENLNLNRDVSVNLKGGYDPNFTDVIGVTLLRGKLTISNGKLTVNNLIIRQNN